MTNPYAPNQKIFLVGPMTLIILFPIFIHPIIPYYYLQLILIILLLHQFTHLFYCYILVTMA
jgi:hypothetical protein